MSMSGPMLGYHSSKCLKLIWDFSEELCCQRKATLTYKGSVKAPGKLSFGGSQVFSDRLHSWQFAEGTGKGTMVTHEHAVL